MHYRSAQPDEPTRVPLLCIHSSPSSGRLYEHFLPLMATDRLVLAPDTPGFGYSDPPLQEPGIEDYSAAMGDFVDALGLKQVDLLGYHTGSDIAVALALLRPCHVRRVVMISAPIFSEDELDDFRRHYAPKTPTASGDYLVDTWKERLVLARAGDWPMENVAEHLGDVMRRPDVSWWGHNAAFKYPIGDALSEVSQPLLVLNPDDDLTEQTLRAVPIVGEANVKRLPGWAHGLLEVHGEAAAHVIRKFLDSDDALDGDNG
jgi:pimeloyl-ACP methyl ester carboxylesterase